MLFKGYKQKNYINEENENIENSNENFRLSSLGLIKEITQDLSNSYLEQGKGVYASALHLSIKDIEGSVMKLLRTNDIAYAFALTQLFEISFDENILIKMASNANLNNEKFVSSIFINKIKKKSDKKNALLQRFGNEKNVDSKKIEDFQRLAEENKSKLNYSAAIFNYILAKNSELSFTLATDFVKSSNF